MNNEIKNKIFWYSKNWYKTTGDKVKDLEIILKDNYLFENWTCKDAVSILLNNFEDVFKDKLRKIFDETIFDWYNIDKNIELKLLNSLLSIISFTEIKTFEDFIDEKYQYMYNLKEENNES